MKQTFLLLFFFSVATISCDSQPSKDIVVGQPNPTVYVFHSSLESVKKAIVTSLDDYKFQSTIGKENLDSKKDEIVMYEYLHTQTYDKDDKHMWPDAEKILSKPDNNNDVYLYTFGYAPSQVYYSDNCKDPLIFSADYHLHLDKVDEHTTKVTVNTINHRVVTGKELIPTPQMCGIGRSAIIKTVPLTTVEQYEMLLRIGETISEKNMPKIIVPTKVCLTRTGKLKQ